MVLSEARLRELYAQSARYVTERLSGILLSEDAAPLRGEVYTVYTYFERGGIRSGLALCGEAELFLRLTKRMMRSDQVEPQDVEDFSREYFNVLCGRVTSAVFQETKVAARFQIPSFCRGRYRPEDGWESWALPLRSDQDERALLIHYKGGAQPCPRDSQAGINR